MKELTYKIARAMGRMLSHLLHSNGWKRLLRMITEILTINAIKH